VVKSRHPLLMFFSVAFLCVVVGYHLSQVQNPDSEHAPRKAVLT
jgi:hypothetical protein